MEQLQALFSTAGLRLTRPRVDVFQLLNQAQQPLTIGQITKTCPEIDRASIYRTLEVFKALGIIEIIHVGWKKQYELAGPFKPHHHHLQCTVCRRLTTLDTPELERLIESIARKHSYVISSHHFELHGICQLCRP